MNKIYQQHWIELPNDIRKHLIGVFGIMKTGIAEVRDTTLISDGVTNNDLQVITEVKMQEYVGSKEAFPRLWELTLAKAKYELNPPQELPSAPTTYSTPKGEVMSMDPEVVSVPKEMLEAAKELLTSLPPKSVSDEDEVLLLPAVTQTKKDEHKITSEESGETSK